MGMILRIASSRIVGQGDIVGRSGYFSLNLSANSVMRGRLDARRTLKSLVADLRFHRSPLYFMRNIKPFPRLSIAVSYHCFSFCFNVQTSVFGFKSRSLQDCLLRR